MYQLYEVNRFGGVNLIQPPHQIGDEEAQFATNITYDKYGWVQRRRHTKDVYGATFSGLHSGYIFHKDGKKYVIACAENNIYVNGELKVEGHSYTRYQFAQYGGYLYIINGDEGYVFDGTTFSTPFIAIPKAIPGVSAGGAGNPNGNYSWKYTYYTTHGESLPSPATATVALSSQQGQIGINSDGDYVRIVTNDDYGILGIKFYRTVAGGSSYLYSFSATNETINDSAGIQYDNVADGSLGDSIHSFGAPSKSKYLAAHYDFMFYAGIDGFPNRLYWSNQYFPLKVTSTDYTFCGESGDDITGITVFGGTLIVFCKANVFRVTGRGEVYTQSGVSYRNWVVSRVPSAVGCTAPYSIANAGSRIYYCYRDGVYAFDGVTSIKISDKVDPIFDDFTGEVADNIIGKYHDGKYYIIKDIRD